MGITAALNGLNPQERTALERRLPLVGPENPKEIRRAVSDHGIWLSQHGVLEAVSLSELLQRILQRWDELGAQGRRLAAGISAYYTDLSDVTNDLSDEGLTDDLRVVRSACNALSIEEPAPED